jgi:ABC-2 type transport system ATP-binding protein
MKQRFGIAQALLGNPQLIILDEPTVGLDPTERNRFLNLLSSIGEERIVLLSTHIVADVHELCTRMAIIDRGEVLVEGPPQAAIDEIRGAVWKKLIKKSELQEDRSQVRVISTHLVAGKTEIRVFSRTQPDATFAPMEAELEDVYFLKLGPTVASC